MTGVPSVPSVSGVSGVPSTSRTPGVPRAPGETGTPDTPLDRMLTTAVERSLALLRQADPDAAAEIARLRSTQPRPCAVIVGETKRGKSALLNALASTPDLSPVDVAPATATYLEFRYLPERGARAYLPDRDAPVPLDLADLRDWATVDGLRRRGVLPARRIEVDHPAPLLRDMTLVDTPGVGGLDPAHAEVTLDVAQRATVLLFVTDAAAPLTRPELDFLAAASQRVDAVLFGLAKVDAYPGWRTILADDRALLQTHAPRFAAAPWFPVSARLAELAATVPGEATAALARESGMDELRGALVALAGRARLIRHANLLRGVRSELARLDTAAVDRIRAVDADPGDVARAKRDRAALAARHRTDSRQWTLTLRTETERARVEMATQLRDVITSLEEELLDQIDRRRGAELASLPAEVDQRLHALSVRLSRMLETCFGEVGGRVLAQAFPPDELSHLLLQMNASLRHTLNTRPPRQRGGAGNTMIAMSAGSLAFTAGRGAMVGASVLGAGSAIGAGLLVPVAGVGLGLAAGAFVFYQKRVAADRNQARTWLRQVVTEARAALTDEIAHRFTDLHHALALAVDAATERRQQELDSHLVEIDRAAARDAAGRASRKAALRHEREALRARVAQLDEVLARVAHLSTAG